MHSPKCLRCLSCYSFITLLLTCSSLVAAVNLDQTIPQDGLACPNDALQFTCTSSGNVLLFTVGSTMQQQFMGTDSVNDSLSLGNFVVELVVQNETTISATFTNERVMSSDSGTSITCAGEGSVSTRNVTIADGPANCSNMTIDLVCQITTNAGNDSETLISVMLSASESLMCAVEYLIQFSGKNRTVPVSSTLAEFPISFTEGEPFDNEMTVYTLDYENRIGQIPCFFSIHIELSAVENFDYVPECDPSLNLIMTFSWREPSVLGSCSVADMPLEYMYFIEFSNSQFTNSSTKSTSYQLMDVPPGTVLGMTITPALPSQGLTGPPLTSTVNLVGVSCTTSSSSSSTSPTPSPGGDSQNIEVIVIPSVLGAVVIIVVILVLITVICIKRNKCHTLNLLKLSGSQTQGSAHNRSEIPLVDKSTDPEVKETGETKDGADPAKTNPSLQQKLAEYKKVIEDLLQKLENQNQEIQNLKRELGDANKAKQELERRLNEAYGQNDKQKEMIQELLEKIRRLEQQLDELMRHKTTTELELKNMDHKLDQLKEENLNRDAKLKDELRNELKEDMESIIQKHLQQSYSEAGRKEPASATASFSKPVESTCKGDQSSHGDDSAFASGKHTELEQFGDGSQPPARDDQEVAGSLPVNHIFNTNGQSYTPSVEEQTSHGHKTKSDMVIAAPPSSASSTSKNQKDQVGNIESTTCSSSGDYSQIAVDAVTSPRMAGAEIVLHGKTPLPSSSPKKRSSTETQ